MAGWEIHLHPAVPCALGKPKLSSYHWQRKLISRLCPYHCLCYICSWKKGTIWSLKINGNFLVFVQIIFKWKTQFCLISYWLEIYFTSKSIFRCLTNSSLKTQILIVLQEKSICLHLYTDSDLKNSKKSEEMYWWKCLITFEWLDSSPVVDLWKQEKIGTNVIVSKSLTADSAQCNTIKIMCNLTERSNDNITHL